MDDLYQKVASLQNEKRYNHTLRVIEMAKRLAKTYNVDIEKCELAALLHDVTKQFNKEQQQVLLMEVDDQFIYSNLPLWHSYTGSVYASKELKINDIQILDAIKYHTIGYKHACPITQVIYLADYLELGREYRSIRPFREQIGKVSLRTLYEMVAKNRIEYELSCNHQLHPLTKELYESII